MMHSSYLCSVGLVGLFIFRGAENCYSRPVNNTSSSPAGKPNLCIHSLHLGESRSVRAVYISIHFGLLLHAAAGPGCTADVMVKKSDGSQTCVSILPLSGEPRSAGGCGTSCPWGWLSADLSLSRRSIWRRTGASSWLHGDYTVLASLSTWRLFLPLIDPSSPSHCQAREVISPGASVKLQHRFRGLLPPQANPSFLPHFRVIKDVLHARGNVPAVNTEGRRRCLLLPSPGLYSHLDMIHVDLWAN